MRPKLSSKEKDFFLVQRALCGDQEAYSAIFKKYRIILTIQISDIVNDSDLTELPAGLSTECLVSTYRKELCDRLLS